MDAYLSQMSVLPGTYSIPQRLLTSIQESSSQVVATWFIIHTCTARSYISLQSCRKAIAPTCNWDGIGKAVKLLLDHDEIPEDLLHLHSIGRGNTTVVVGHHGTNSLVAIKQQIFRRGSWEVSSHVLHELLALRRLNGQTWTPIQAFHVVSQDMVQIGMEYIPLTVKQMLRFGAKNRIFIHRMISELFSAVHCLHSLGMAHRDIKPDNIRFRSDGTLVLIDYDSCTTLGATIERTRRVCTAGYRDPFLFDPVSDMTLYDYRTLDAFSCGAVYLYVLQGGKHVFDGGISDMEVLAQMTLYIQYQLRPFCERIKLTPTESVVLQGLLDPTPDKRLTLTQAVDAYHNRE
jgi:serine/threonine protein kinase